MFTARTRPATCEVPLSPEYHANADSSEAEVDSHQLWPALPANRERSEVRGQPSTGVPDHGNGLPMSSQDSDDEVKDMTRPLLDVSAARQTESEIPSIGDMILVRPSTDDESATGHKFFIGKLIEGTYFIAVICHYPRARLISLSLIIII